MSKKNEEEKYKIIESTDCKITLMKEDKTNYHAEKISDTKLKIMKGNPDHIISIINVYAPTTERAKKHQNEIKKLYKDLSTMQPTEETSDVSNFYSRRFQCKSGEKNQQQ